MLSLQEGNVSREKLQEAHAAKRRVPVVNAEGHLVCTAHPSLAILYLECQQKQKPTS